MLKTVGLAMVVSLGVSNALAAEVGTKGNLLVEQFNATAAYAQCYQLIKSLPQCSTDADKQSTGGCIERIYQPDNPEVLVSETTYAQGKKHGYELIYFEGGSLYKVMPFTQGKADGTSFEFNRSGQLVETVQFFKGMRHGPTLGFYEDANPKFEGNYALDQLEGHFRTYYFETGKLQADINYVQGKRSGDTKFYDEQGNLYLEATFKDDKAISGKCATGRLLESEELRHLFTNPPQC